MTTISPADEAAIRDLAQTASDAQLDTAALTRLHTVDALIVNIVGMRILGREAFAQAMTTALVSGLAQVRTSIEVVDIRPVTEDVALVSLVKSVRDERGEASNLPLAGSMTYVAVRVAEGWRIALAQTTPIAR